MKRRIVTTTSVFEPGYPAERAIERLAGLGYEALDMALDYWVNQPDSPFLGDGYLEWAKKLKKKADNLGVPYVQSHAPAGLEENADLFARSLETSKELGVSYMVVHPIGYYPDGTTIIEDEKEFIRINSEFLQPWIEKAQQCGVIILAENLLWGATRDPRTIAALVQEVGSEWFGWCYDTGHANCFGYLPEVLRECAVPPLSLHIQDNYGIESDDHLIPGDGTVDFKTLLEVLKEVGYTGECVLEAHHQSLSAPDQERDGILTRLLDVAKIIRGEMDS